MSRIKYQNFKPRIETSLVIALAEQIIVKFESKGYDLTLRQLYYQFIAQDLFPDSWIDVKYNQRHGLPDNAKNTDKNYGKLGSIINRARLAGMIDWESIVDRTRINKSNPHWNNPEEIIKMSAKAFALDSRSTQDTYLEVWVEKDALIGIIEPICRHLDILFLSCRGFISQSAMWQASQRFIDKEIDGKETILLHLSDHDPSGINMTMDIQNRLEIFETNTEVKRIALTMTQVNEYNPPPNPAKISDSRYRFYATLFGEESWELDALDPSVITEIISNNINEHTDEEKRQTVIDSQEQYKDDLQYIADNWDDINNSKLGR